jgi:hypothetical protein
MELGTRNSEVRTKEKIERWKILAELYLTKDTLVMIKDIYDNWYIGDILIVGENTIRFFCLAPKQRAGIKFTLEWAKITYFDKDKGRKK